MNEWKSVSSKFEQEWDKINTGMNEWMNEWMNEFELGDQIND